MSTYVIIKHYPLRIGIYAAGVAQAVEQLIRNQ